MKKMFKRGFILIMSIVLLIGCIAPLSVYAANEGRIRKENGKQVAYYTTMSKAFTDINANAWGRAAIPNSNLSIAGIKTTKLKDGFLIEMRKNFKETSVVTINTGANKKIYIDMKQYILAVNGTGIDIISGDVEIYAKGIGGVLSNNTAKARCVQLRSGKAKIKGGRYVANSKDGSAAAFQSAGNLKIEDTKIIGLDNTGEARCVTTMGGAKTELINCDMQATAKCGVALAFYNAKNSIATVKGGRAHGYSNYESQGTNAYTYASKGIGNYGDIQLINVDVYGTHSGVQSNGTIRVNGGNYAGYGHGGFYICEDNNIAYIKNATISCGDLLDGYVATIACNNAAMYIGCGDGIKTYVDNCEFIAKSQTIVLRGTDKEKNCELYISNSSMPQRKKFRIDSNHIVYLGLGNEFDASIADNPSKVIETDMVYTH